MYDVSVIIPMYNVKDWISRCLDSVCKQTLNSIEIIVVDDGSTDGSLYIAERYAAMDNRVTVLKQTQCGPGAARNAGLLRAQGRYIQFLDSDDWLDRNALQTLTDAADKNDADIVLFGACYETGRTTEIKDRFLLNDGEVVERNDFSAVIFPAMLRSDRLNSSCWKLYRLDMLRSYNVQFNTKLWNAEDLQFNAEAFTNARRLVAVNQRPYHYWRANTGLTSRSGAEKVMPYCNSCLQLFGYLKLWNMDCHSNRQALATRAAIYSTRLLFEIFKPNDSKAIRRKPIIRHILQDRTIRCMCKNATFEGCNAREKAELLVAKTGSIPFVMAFGYALLLFRALPNMARGRKHEAIA